MPARSITRLPPARPGGAEQAERDERCARPQSRSPANAAKSAHGGAQHEQRPSASPSPRRAPRRRPYRSATSASRQRHRAGRRRSRDAPRARRLSTQQYRGQREPAASAMGMLMKKIARHPDRVGQRRRRRAARRSRRRRRPRPTPRAPCCAPRPPSNVVMRIDSAVGAISAAEMPWTTARADEEARRAREPARERRRREQRGARDEGPPAAEQVARAAAEHEQPAEREQVGAEHPLRAVLGEAEVALHRRQRHDDDLRVEDHHQGDRAEQRERLPAPGIWFMGHATHDQPRATNSSRPGDRRPRSVRDPGRTRSPTRCGHRGAR